MQACILQFYTAMPKGAATKLKPQYMKITVALLLELFVVETALLTNNASWQHYNS